LAVRAHWQRIEVKGYRRYALFYRWDDLRAIKEAQNAWAVAAAMEPYVFPNDPDGHRWHRLQHLASRRMTHLNLQAGKERSKNGHKRALARLRYNALLCRLRFRKPQGRHWHIEKVPGDQHWLRSAIREDELPLLFDEPTPHRAQARGQNRVDAAAAENPPTQTAPTTAPSDVMTPASPAPKPRVRLVPNENIALVGDVEKVLSPTRRRIVEVLLEVEGRRMTLPELERRSCCDHAGKLLRLMVKGDRGLGAGHPVARGRQGCRLRHFLTFSH